MASVLSKGNTHFVSLIIIDMRLYQITETRGEGLNAGPKAQSDAETILHHLGAIDVVVRRFDFTARNVLIRIFGRILWEIELIKVFFKVQQSSVLFVQYPSGFLVWHGFLALKWLKRIKHVRIVMLVHDLPSQRIANSSSALTIPDYFIRESLIADTIIVHNSAMSSLFRNCGLSENKLVELGVFDYLTNCCLKEPNFVNVINVAGNLSLVKAGYLKSLSTIKSIRWQLFGNGFDNVFCSAPNIAYAGSYLPEDLPSKLNLGFGLVWDGSSASTCEGKYGEYLKVNAPHKISLYIASGLPIIIWRHAAEARFILNEDIGIVVDSLFEIPNKISQCSLIRYKQMVFNVRKWAERVRTGWSLTNAMHEAIKRMED